jgi:curved DNA-binding protein CbpA
VSQNQFVDFYEILQVSPNADQDTIQRVFRLLAQRFHPDNKDSGNEGAFKEVMDAYRVLNDPEQRAAYDVEHRQVKKVTWQIFDQSTASQGVEAEKRKRKGILALLYNKRLNEPEAPGISIREMEDLLGCPREHLEFSLWYLKENQWAVRGDNGRHVITAKGVDIVERDGEVGIVDQHHLLPLPQSTPMEPDEAIAWN